MVCIRFFCVAIISFPRILRESSLLGTIEFDSRWIPIMASSITLLTMIPGLRMIAGVKNRSLLRNRWTRIGNMMKTAAYCGTWTTITIVVGKEVFRPNLTAEPLSRYRFGSYDENLAALPSSIHCPPVDYIRPSDSSVQRGQSPTYLETARPPAFESGQFSHGGRSSGSRRARIADRSPPPVSSSRSHDQDFGPPFSSAYSKGKSCLGRLVLGA